MIDFPATASSRLMDNTLVSDIDDSMTGLTLLSGRRRFWDTTWRPTQS